MVDYANPFSCCRAVFFVSMLCASCCAHVVMFVAMQVYVFEMHIFFLEVYVFACVFYVPYFSAEIHA